MGMHGLPIRLASLASLGLLAVTPALGDPSPVRFGTPVENQTVRPGETVAVVIDVDPNTGATWASLIGSSFGPQEVHGPPFEATIDIPMDYSGPYDLMTTAASEPHGLRLGAAELSINVVPDLPPVSISILDSQLLFGIPDNVRPKRIYAFGRYADDVKRAIYHAGLGTSYESSDPGVAVADDEGYVHPISPGQAVITVANGDAREWLAVKVDDSVTKGYPPVDQTSNVVVSGSGYRHEPAIDLFVQRVSIMNVSSAPLIRPLVVIFDDFPAGVYLYRQSGVTKVVQPLGTPWQIVDTEPGVLRPGEVVTTEVRFRNPENSAINYSARIYSAAFQ